MSLFDFVVAGLVVWAIFAVLLVCFIHIGYLIWDFCKGRQWNSR